QGRPSERLDPEKRTAKRRARLALQFRHVLVPENKRAGHCPLAGLTRAREHERIGRIEPDGADQFHARGPRVVGSSHEGAPSSAASFLRATSALPRRRSSRSPLSSMSRRRPLSRGRGCRYSFATAPKPCYCQASVCTIRGRAKLSTSAPAVKSENPSSSCAATSGLSPGSPSPIDTVRIIAPN